MKQVFVIQILDTDFMLNISTEISQGGYVFDGMTTTKAVNVELRFGPVISGNNDVYYKPDLISLSPIQVPAELCICRDTYFELGIGKVLYRRAGTPREQ